MKKLIACIAAVVAVQLFSPILPAQAASLNEQLTQLAAQQAYVGRIQQLLALKNQLQQINTQQLVETLARTASGQANAIRNGSNVFEQVDARQAVQDILRRQVGETITDKMAPYQKELAAISSLLMNQPLQPKSVKENNSLTEIPKKYKKVLNMTATAYAPGMQDNGNWGSQTYVGGVVQSGVAAVDPKVIPMGSKLWVEGYGEAIAEDQGSAIKGNRIDLVFNNRQDALDYGIRQVKVYVLN